MKAESMIEPLEKKKSAKDFKLDLERIIEECKMPSGETIEGIPYCSRYCADFPVDFLINVVDRNNYRQHSMKDVISLSDSIKSEGVLQPVVLNYDTKNDRWELVAGEGRSWGYYLSKALVGPVQIYYDLPPEILLRMKVGTNSTKTPIDAEDIAKYTQGLYDLLQKYNVEGSNLKDFVKAGTSLEDLSKILHRSPKTVSDYLVFNNNLHANIKDYVDSNREKNLYWKSVRIARALPNRNHQMTFFSKMLSEEEKRRTLELEKKRYAKSHGKYYKMKDVRLSQYAFTKQLKAFAIQVLEPVDQLCMKHPTSNHKAGDAVLKDIYSDGPRARRYIDAFKNILEQYSEIKNESSERILSHINMLKNNYARLMQLLPEDMTDEIMAYLEKPREKTLQQLVFEQAEKRRTADISDKLSDIDRVRAIGEKIVYIPIGDIVLEKSQLRSRYKAESIDALAKEITAYGQVDPGLVTKVDVDGTIKYKIIFGHSRYKALVKAGKKFYKAFVRENLSDVEITLLQAIEDLSERDSPVERAKVINKQYNLMKLIAEKEHRMYTKENFIEEFHHFGNRKILRDALEFWELDEGLRNMVAAKQVSYEASLKIGQLNEKDRLNVLYNVMASRLKGKSLDKYIQNVKAKAGHTSMFNDVPVSYCRVLDEFEGESSKPFNYLSSYLANEKIRERILSPQVIIHFTQIYKSVLNLEKSIAA